MEMGGWGWVDGDGWMEMGGAVQRFFPAEQQAPPPGGPVAARDGPEVLGWIRDGWGRRWVLKSRARDAPPPGGARPWSMCCYLIMLTDVGRWACKNFSGHCGADVVRPPGTGSMPRLCVRKSKFHVCVFSYVVDYVFSFLSITRKDYNYELTPVTRQTTRKHPPQVSVEV